MDYEAQVQDANALPAETAAPEERAPAAAEDASAEAGITPEEATAAPEGFTESDPFAASASADIPELPGWYLPTVAAVSILAVVSMWKLFSKAKKPGWAALIPFYNLVVLTQISGRSGLFSLTYVIPFVNFVTISMTYYSLGRRFGKGPLFSLGMIFLSPLLLPVLAFGKAEYQPKTTPPAPESAGGGTHAAAPPLKKAA